jgi:CHAD domain-containing protein
VVILRERGTGTGNGESDIRGEPLRDVRYSARRHGAQAAPPGWARRLELPAAHAAADEALALAQKVDDAVAHLQDGTDPEALHDFRVAMRRLRAWLRGFQPVLPVRGRTRRRLQRVSRRTNAARDAEAALAWLQTAARSLEPRLRNSLRVLQSELTAALTDMNKALAARVAEDWMRVSRRLHKELMDRAPQRGVDETFGGVWAEAVERALVEAVDRRRAAATGGNEGAIHRYRISLKRVRYLLEPAVQVFPDAERAVRQAKRGQERAGAINDLQHLLAWMRRRSRELSARRGEAVFELRLAGREAEAQRVLARGSYRLRPLVVAGRLAVQDLNARTAAFEEAESRGREPRYANGVRRVVQSLRATKSRRARAVPSMRQEGASKTTE